MCMHLNPAPKYLHRCMPLENESQTITINYPVFALIIKSACVVCIGEVECNCVLIFVCLQHFSYSYRTEIGLIQMCICIAFILKLNINSTA